MDSEPVKLWRDFARLNLSASWKRDVEKTVTDIELWRKILEGWHYFDAKGKKHNKHPGIKGLLTEYERLSMETADSRDNEARALSTRSGARIPQRSDGDVSKMRIEPPSLYFRVG